MSSYSIIVCPKEKLDPYLGLIHSRWKRSLRDGNDLFKLIDKVGFFEAYNHYVQRILDSEESKVALAVLTENPDIVLGFSVSRGTVLDYVHVSKDYRDRDEQGKQKEIRHHICTSLIPSGIDTFTHWTKHWSPIWGNRFNSWKFNPFI